MFFSHGWLSHVFSRGRVSFDKSSGHDLRRHLGEALGTLFARPPEKGTAGIIINDGYGFLRIIGH